MDRKKIKEQAKELAFKNKWALWKPYLVIFGISFLLSFILAMLGIDENGELGTFLTFVLEIALVPASIGYVYYIIKFIHGKSLDVKEALTCKYKLFGLILLVTILVGIFTFLWSLLLIIPGIIYALSMNMTNYLLADLADEDTKYKDVMKTSKEMMDGYKWDYFVFGLSFIGWILLVVVTFGIAIIWVYPYIMTANVMYYEELKKKKKIKTLKSVD